MKSNVPIINSDELKDIIADGVHDIKGDVDDLCSVLSEWVINNHPEFKLRADEEALWDCPEGINTNCQDCAWYRGGYKSIYDALKDHIQGHGIERKLKELGL